MPQKGDEYPHRDEVLDYVRWYEAHYQVPVERPVHVESVTRSGSDFRISTDRGVWTARAVISATGTWASPYIPDVPGRDAFEGLELHSAGYRSPETFSGQRVLVVGGGNSGAQIMAEVARYARATWVTLEEPRFLPDDVDGRVLFEQSTARYRAKQAGQDPGPVFTLGDIVAVPTVRAARDRGDLAAVRPFGAMTSSGVVWPDGREEAVDAVIWCTGFGPALDHLRPLGVVGADGRVATKGTRSTAEPNLWLVGYGSWTGYASATLIGVGRTARATVDEVTAALVPPD
jgi:cation diffusion facilitator CzcD-associated flavoprotein CzcO